MSKVLIWDHSWEVYVKISPSFSFGAMSSARYGVTVPIGQSMNLARLSRLLDLLSAAPFKEKVALVNIFRESEIYDTAWKRRIERQLNGTVLIEIERA